MMITFQCDALVEEFNVTPLIIGLVAPICLRFVALSGVFDDGWADKAIHDSELQSEDVREVKRDKAEPRNFNGKRAVMIWLSQLRKCLPLSSSLSISFLACHKAGAPVLPADIVRWAREGKVPYQSCSLKIHEKMGKRCPVEMFKPNEIVSAQSLEARAASIADIIGLPLPPVNFYGIASNYLKQLSIPDDDKKVVDIVRLIQNWSMQSELYLSKNELRLPTRVCVMSIVIVAIRMLYNISGFGVWEQSKEHEVSETGSAAEELPKASGTEGLLKNLEAKYDETVDYDKKGLGSYLWQGKNELFAGLVEASADDTYRNVDNLWNGYTKEEVQTPLKRGRDWEADGSLSLDDNTKFSDGNNPPRERAIRRVIREMRENMFCYIPPRVKVKRLDYLHYVRKNEDGSFIYPSHADYYILLRLCARVAEIDARNMQRGVLSFERRLAWTERKLAQVLHSYNDLL